MVPSKQFDTHLLSRYLSCSFFSRTRAMSLRTKMVVMVSIYHYHKILIASSLGEYLSSLWILEIASWDSLKTFLFLAA